MPGWLIGWVISLLVKFGLAWLVKKLPWIPAEVIELLKELLTKKQDPALSVEEKRVAEKETRRRIRRVCIGVGCSPDLKGEE